MSVRARTVAASRVSGAGIYAVAEGLTRDGILSPSATELRRNHYRCTYAAEYADSKRSTHPRNVYLREDKIIELLVLWAGQALSLENLHKTPVGDGRPQHDGPEQYEAAAKRSAQSARPCSRSACRAQVHDGHV